MTDILKTAKDSFNKKSSEYGLTTSYIDERTYTCGFVEGVLFTNNLYNIQIDMLQAKIKELEKVQSDFPTLNRQ